MVKFKSQATGELVMVQAHAAMLLKLLGKVPEQGIIEVADMPRMLAILKGIPDEPVNDEGLPVGRDADEDKEKRLAFSDEPVSLRKRAWPLVQMIERAQAEGHPIVWGV